MNDIEQFRGKVQQNIQSLAQSKDLQSLPCIWLHEVIAHKYHYNSTWMGLPIIQCPQDVLVIQQLIWRVKPGLIIETDIARGDSLVFYASMLESPAQGGHDEGTALDIDIDIHQHNCGTTEVHPMVRRVQTPQGSSIDSDIIKQVKCIAAGKQHVLVALDPNRTHDYMLVELGAYTPLTNAGNYCVASDAAAEGVPQAVFNDRLWGIGDNPKAAVRAYLRDHPESMIDADTHHKLPIAAAPDGYLKRVAWVFRPIAQSEKIGR